MKHQTDYLLGLNDTFTTEQLAALNVNGDGQLDVADIVTRINQYRRVPADYPTIQAAIDAAIEGDEVVVSPGTYFENIHFLGKNIILRSLNPLDSNVVETTIIDGNSSGSVVTFAGTEGTTCALTGFTIRNGRNQFIAGIVGNGNEALIGYNHITDNDGLVLAFCHGIIAFNNISNNSGGGAFISCHGIIQNNIIANNGGLSAGGLFGCEGIIQNNLIINNFGSSVGGLFRCRNALIRNNVIYNNLATFGMGGIQDCTNATIINCIIRRNFSYFGGISLVPAQIDGNPLPSYSNVEGWGDFGVGNIDADPLFINGFRLRPDSPCIDTGGATTLRFDFDGNPRPLDGDGLGAGSTGDGSDFDIGAFEFVP